MRTWRTTSARRSACSPPSCRVPPLSTSTTTTACALPSQSPSVGHCVAGGQPCGRLVGRGCCRRHARLRVHTAWSGDVAVAARASLPGGFNVRNAALAVVALVTGGLELDVAVAGVAACAAVPGRMERVDAGQPFLAVVDYAHTPDAVTTLLGAVRPLVAGQLIVVLGCGGDRDRGKRPVDGPRRPPAVPMSPCSRATTRARRIRP